MSSMIETAARCSEEHRFLCAIARNLCDDSLKLIYADWLEERGDARSEFVRHFTAATQQNALEKVDCSTFPEAWLDALGVTLITSMYEAELEDQKNAILRLARPALWFALKRVPEKSIPSGSTKFGGHPDLPAGVRWPTCEMGPLEFIGQIAMSDLALSLVASDLPKAGLLSLFAFQDSVSGYAPGMKMAGDTQFLFWPDPSSLNRVRAPDLNEMNSIKPSCIAQFQDSLDIPNRTGVVEVDEDGFWSMENRCGGHHLFGYPVHGTGDDPTPGPEWVHFLSLGSHGQAEWNWGDAMHLDTFIPAEDLRNQVFGRVYGYVS